MWHLRRIHMESVGHPDARFDPLTVSFTDIAGVPTATVLWLENMGGKTSWLSLVFCTLRPSLNEFLGMPDKRLGDYVLATDTAHVVLEFAQIAGSRRLADSGTRLLVGQVLQWKQRRQETNRESAQLARQFWAAVVPPTGGRLTFEEAVRLMHTENDQRRPMSDYLAQLSSTMDADVFRPDDNQRRWLNWLGLHGLDPEVFADQLKMSADEGSISERFHFEDGDQLVQWAMPYIMPPQVPEGVAKVVEEVRGTLLKRPELLVQQQFCRTVETKLTYAAAQQAQLEEQRAEAVGGWDTAVVLADQFRAAMIREGKSVEHHRERAKVYEAKAADALSIRNQRQQQSRQAQLVAARLHHEEVSKRHGELTTKLQGAQDRVDAWETTDRLRQMGRLRARLDQIDELLQELDDQAEPLRKQVARAERRLAAKLTTLRNAGQAELDRVDNNLKAAKDQIESADGELQEAQDLGSQATGDMAIAEERLRQLDSELIQAVEDGLIKVGQPIDDAIETTSREHDRVGAEVDRLKAVAEEAQLAATERESELEQDRETVTQARAGRDRAKARSDAVDHALERLLQTPGLTAAFEAEHPDVWQDGEAAADRLGRQAEQASAERVELELIAATDTRAVDWLHRTGLLPPSQDVESVLAVLQSSPDIRLAYSGWDVLRRTVPAERQAAVIARFPEVVNGVVLEDAGDLSAVARIAESLVLTAPVVLSVASVLGGDRDDEPYLVLPGPAALYDEGAATTETRTREARLESVANDKQPILEREDEARTARTALRTFLDHHPAEAVARRRAELAEQEQLLEEYRDRFATTEEAYRQARLAAQTAADAVPPVRDRLAELGRAQLALQRLNDSQAVRPTTNQLLREAKERLAEARRRRQRAETVRRTAIDQQSDLAEARTQISIRISDLDSTFTRHHLVTSDETPPSDPVDNLESALAAARSELLRASAPDQLVREKGDRQKELAELATGLRQADQRIVALAKDLLTSPSGATLGSREAALRQAKQHATELGRAAVLSEKALGEARVDLREKEASPQGRRAPLDEEPATAQEARELHIRLTAESAAAYEEYTAAGAAQNHHTTTAANADLDRKTFKREAEDLAVVLRRHAATMDRPAELLDFERVAAPWSGTPEQAEQARRKREMMLDEAAEYIRIATHERDKALEDVRHLATQYRQMLTDELPTLLPRLTEGSADQRGGYARELTGQLHTFALTIEKELVDVERHRRVVIEHLVGKVKETVKLLERMQRRTRLPAGLEDWSDRPFLHLTHPRLPETTEELSGKVATVVDNVCADPNKTVPSGIDLLYSAVSAAVGGPFEATILKPHKRLKNERVDIGDMAAFSGGQKVTVALVMFAALTRMRTEARSGGMETNAALPLLLDNPIGKANQATLMEVQQRVAEAFGLQLIYTTGLHDVGALASFKNIVRLDGRENPRSGHVHLVVEPKAADLVYLDSIRLIQHEEREDD